MRIALFVTCLTETFYPRAAIAAVTVLEHLGHEVVFPSAQTCCGQPMHNGGHLDDARALAARMIDLFAEHDRIVTPSGSCAAMVREHYPVLFPSGRMHDRAVDLGRRTHEFVELLVEVLRVDLAALGAALPVRATWHPSCHLRGIQEADACPRLLETIDGFEHVPLDRPEQCCGFGGAFSVRYPELSGAMAADKAHAIGRTGSSIAVCNDAGCAMNIEGACRRAGVAVRFASAAELIAEALGLDSTPSRTPK